VRICYVVLSPTFGMHQYTADLANSSAGARGATAGWAQVSVVTGRAVPRDRYAPIVDLHPVVNITGTGLQRNNANIQSLHHVQQAILATRPDVVHFTGPHIWNTPLVLMLRRRGIPIVHTIHDLDPHSGAGYGRLLYIWNHSIVRWANHILVHGKRYRDRLASEGLAVERVTYTPLLHLFLSYQAETQLHQALPRSEFKPQALFFARLERYKGVDVLIDAMRRLSHDGSWGVIIAGKGDSSQLGDLSQIPENVEVRNRLIEDAEALELFTTCGVVVLPYRDATQSALIAAAYFFGKPVIVTRSGALAEYVEDGQTGWVVTAGDAEGLADRLKDAFADTDRLQRMGEAGRNWYQAERGQERRTLRSMYEQLVCKRESSRR
jgi:glycosyltransferase involved in cell wall biosynthesis